MSSVYFLMIYNCPIGFSLMLVNEGGDGNGNGNGGNGNRCGDNCEGMRQWLIKIVLDCYIRLQWCPSVRLFSYYLYLPLWFFSDGHRHIVFQNVSMPLRMQTTTVVLASQ